MYEIPPTGSLSRRDWFRWAQTGIGGSALLSLLLRDGVVRPSRFRARRAIRRRTMRRRRSG